MIENEGIKRLRKYLIETGIYIRKERDGKWQPVDYINLRPGEVQAHGRWDEKGWTKILNNILGCLGAAMLITELPVEEKVLVGSRDIIVAIVSLLEHAGVEAKDKFDASLIVEPEPHGD